MNNRSLKIPLGDKANTIITRHKYRGAVIDLETYHCPILYPHTRKRCEVRLPDGTRVEVPVVSHDGRTFSYYKPNTEVLRWAKETVREWLGFSK